MSNGRFALTPRLAWASLVKYSNKHTYPQWPTVFNIALIKDNQSPELLSKKKKKSLARPGKRAKPVVQATTLITIHQPDRNDKPFAFQHLVQIMNMGL